MNNVTRGHFGKGRSPVDSNTPTGGDGGDNGMIERVARLEVDVEYIRRDVAEVKDSTKILMADTTDIRVRLEKLSGRQDIFESKLDSFESKIDAKFEGLDKKFATKSDLYEALNKQQQWMFRTMLTLISVGIGLTGAVVAALIKYLPHS